MEKTVSHLLPASANTHYLFIGYMTNNILDAIAAGIEEVMAVNPHYAGKYRKIFSVYVEMLQNILFYSAERTDIASGSDAAYGGLEIAMHGDAVEISAANPVTAAQHKKLLAIMTHISGLTAAQIAAVYKQKMAESFNDAESRGGGLGYYDIARKSIRPVTFEFVPEANGRQIFKFSAWI